MTSAPETRNAKSGDTYIAYQVIGEGPFDLVFVPGFISHVEMQMESPLFAGASLRTEIILHAQFRPASTRGLGLAGIHAGSGPAFSGAG